MTGKSLRKSRTFWWNIGSFLAVSGAEMMALVDVVPIEYQAPVRIVVVSLVAIGNIILRTVTREPISGM